jgi:DNA-binding NarL/FixJ family response regulator
MLRTPSPCPEMPWRAWALGCEVAEGLLWWWTTTQEYVRPYAGFAERGEAANGQEAISLCKQLKPDLIILDLSMPVMDGLQAAPQLRKLVPNTPIILLTMYGSAFKQDQVAAVGVDFVLSKTERVSDILDKARALLKARPLDLAQGASG